jgi:hypothetical protein
LADLLFGAIIVSLTGSIYNVLFKMKSTPSKKPKHTLTVRKTIFDIILLFSILVILTNVFGINSIYSSAAVFLTLTGLIWFERRDLIKVSLVGSVVLTLSSAIGYTTILSFYPNFINETWLLQNISKIFLFGIPIEEFLWFSTWGLAGAPLYEWGHGYVFKKLNST